MAGGVAHVASPAVTVRTWPSGMPDMLVSSWRGPLPNPTITCPSGSRSVSDVICILSIWEARRGESGTAGRNVWSLGMDRCCHPTSFRAGWGERESRTMPSPLKQRFEKVDAFFAVFAPPSHQHPYVCRCVAALDADATDIMMLMRDIRQHACKRGPTFTK